VIANTSRRKNQIGILVELELREQFEIAKVGECAMVQRNQ